MPCRSRDTLLVHLVKFDGDLHAAPTLPHSARTSHPSVGRSISEKQGAMHCAPAIAGPRTAWLPRKLLQAAMHLSCDEARARTRSHATHQHRCNWRVHFHC